jgi:hypothetical protein
MVVLEIPPPPLFHVGNLSFSNHVDSDREFSFCMLFLVASTHRCSTRWQVIVIGAGWAGAVAARALSRKGISVVVLEARNRVGGRAKTIGPNDGFPAAIDVGCSWIHGFKEGNVRVADGFIYFVCVD